MITRPYMSDMKPLLFITTASFLVVMATVPTIYNHVYASTCAIKETTLTTSQFYRVSDSVFAGTISSISNYTSHQWKIQFNTDKIWKGENRATLTLVAYSLQGCGYSLSVGEKYLVFANGSPLSLNPVLTKPYADAQDAISLYDDPKFQSKEMAKEDLIKKLEAAKDGISNMMGSKMTFGIPFNMVGVDVLNATLDIGIDSTKAKLPKSEYEEKIKGLIGDLPMDVEFAQISPADAGEKAVSPVQNSSSATLVQGRHPPAGQVLQLYLYKMSPMEQYAHGIAPKDVICVQGLQLVIKSEGGSPACVKDASIGRLVRQGWWAWNDKVGDTMVNTPGKKDFDNKTCAIPETASSIVGTNGFARDDLPKNGVVYPGANLTGLVGQVIQFSINPGSEGHITFTYDFNPYPGSNCMVTTKDVIAASNPGKPDVSISGLIGSPDILKVGEDSVNTSIPPLGNSGDVLLHLASAEDLNDHVEKVTYKISAKSEAQAGKSYFIGFWWHSSVVITVGDSLYTGNAFVGSHYG